jgi:hypothetical protein
VYINALLIEASITALLAPGLKWTRSVRVSLAATAAR